ncbi:hypothetical protein [Petrocella sp. FN5]|uniref:hypothetical protein n=1 Tax=Petrocella sp. FN5 TaxID=3032002 RepID=UPI0023DC7BF0|nr:hypothetical protein [Petrocella sp. FN5]MDF1617303.1 hypothetical protein [Petrocella sp. FN5]
MNQHDIETLQIFNEKADKIFTSSFVEDFKNNGIKMNIKIDGGIGHIPTINIPDESFFDALILTLRFFIQDNEEISIRNLNEVYNKDNIKKELKDEFNGTRNELINFLGFNCHINDNGKSYSRREVFDIFIYGNYAHHTKRKEYQVLKNNKFLYPMYCYEFTNILLEYIKSIAKIEAINVELLNINL